MRCPRDGSTLSAGRDVAGPGTTGQVCPRCQGAALPFSASGPLFESLGLTLPDLQALVRKAERRPRPGNEAPPDCPACGKAPLKPFTAKGVELDLCEACGTAWFDRGELARLGKAAPAAAPAPPQSELSSEVVGVYEMLWDCAYCGTRALKGASNRFCPQCGAEQDPTRRYFPPPGEEVAANLAFEGADRRCPACATPNGARANNCRHCGSPLEGAAEVATVADRADSAPAASGAARAALDAGAGGAPRRSTWPWVLGAVALVVVGGVVAAVSWKKEVAVTVVGHAWSRGIDVERLQPVPESAWCDSVPPGAYAVSRSREQRSTRQVPDGEDCSVRDVDRGNGTFERRRECRPRYRSEPVYDERCHFTVDRWVTVRTATASGEGLSPAPAWPDPGLAGRAGLALGAERTGPKHEQYQLRLRGSDGKDYRCTLSEQRWAAMADGERRPVKVGVLTGAVDCDRL